MKTLLSVVLLGSVFVLQGCSHKAVEKQLDEKLTQETAVKDRADLTMAATELISSSPDLTKAEKFNLLALRDSMHLQNVALRDQSLRLRAVLIKDLLATNYNEKEVTLIKKKIKALESKRVALLFDAVDRANIILGRKAVANQGIMQSFVGVHGGGFSY